MRSIDPPVRRRGRSGQGEIPPRRGRDATRKRCVGWAKAQGAVPTVDQHWRCLMVGTLRIAHPTKLLILSVNWSVLETLIAAPPPGIARSITIFRYHFGAFDVVTGKRLCTLNRRHSGPCRGRAVAGRGGESSAAVYRCITRGCNRCPKGTRCCGQPPAAPVSVVWLLYLLRRFDHDVRKRGGGAARACCRLRNCCAA